MIGPDGQATGNYRTSCEPREKNQAAEGAKLTDRIGNQHQAVPYDVHEARPEAWEFGRSQKFVLHALPASTTIKWKMLPWHMLLELGTKFISKRQVRISMKVPPHGIMISELAWEGLGPHGKRVADVTEKEGKMAK